MLLVLMMRSTPFHRGLRRLSAVLAIGLLGCAGAALGSGIKTKKLPDGSTLIYNESETQRARRTSPRLLNVPNSTVAHWIGHYARQQGLSQKLVQAVVQVESGYNPEAVSSKGAMGLMQLMPGTARMLGVKDAFDPQQNIRGGTLYLRRMLERFGDLKLALAAYNAGPGAVERYDGIPPYRETQRYVGKVLGLYQGTAPQALKDHARDQAKARQREAHESRRRTEGQRGKKVYMTRDANNNVIFTTTPPSTH